MRSSGSRRRRAGSRLLSGELLRLLAVALGLGFVWFVSSSVGPGFPGAEALLATVAVVAAASSVALVAALASLVLVLTGGASGGAPPSAAAAVELPATITQSRPDAPGNPQPRAPGRLLAAV
ncbi:DUF6412 domain-containing protein [Herbiconiux liukaitaii]|uniref:DUF6412 domain-containing protein n=1 Tax=Herbiconiux liukaitaii TaxID=3342799 RepID=UPI0035BB07DA